MKNFRVLSCLLCCVFALVIYLADIKILEDIENSTLDHQFRFRGPVAADSRIVIAGIDQETLQWANRPFFAWGPIYAELVNAASNASASVMMFDIIFSPGAENALREHINGILSELSLQLPQSFFRKLGFEKPFRNALIRMKDAGVAFVAGFAWENDQPAFFDPAILHIARSENTGYFNLPTSSDGVIRRIELFARGKSAPVYAISAVSAMGAGLASSALPLEPLQKINFRGGRRTFTTIPLKQIVEDARSGKDLTNLLADKIVMVGFTDITDFKSTPFGYMPGVEVHANAIDNMHFNRFLQPLPKVYELAGLVMLFIFLLILSGISRVAAIVAAILGLMTWLTLGFVWFDPLVIPVVKPSLLLFVFIISESSLAYRAIHLDRQRVRQVFSRYVSDTVVKEILASNDRDFLQGKRRRLCVLIADIRGFTTFSEQHDAHEVVLLLNAYFSRLTEIIMRNRGVVDKFLGDGLLAFFNAPVETADYVDNAVDAAKEIIRYTQSHEFKSICLGTELKVGLALHCGMTVFGNIGSDRKAEFTVIGDTVNACSRMEGLNKDHQTSIIVSAEVVASAKKPTEWKFLAKTSLRGKTEEIDLYTIADREGNNA